jgi:dihydropteroate synthase
MGILNVTPDSFSDGGVHYLKDQAVARALQMAHEGADIIDIGGESTRPGARYIDAHEEIARVLPIVEALVPRLDIPMSIDTRRAEVARAAIEAGCGMVNDVSACADPEMPVVVRDAGAPIILMHMKGDPHEMQVNPRYDDVVGEVRGFLAERAEFAEQQGVQNDMIIIDPGIGFGKRFRDNLDLLRAVEPLRSLGYPVMIGASRKRFLGELLNTEPHDRLSGSLAVAAWCLKNGLDIVRVHDVKETAGLFRVLDAIDHPDDYPASW